LWYLLAGADVVMSASALLRHGPRHATVLLDGLVAWLDRKGYHSIAEVRGLLRVPPGHTGLGSGRSAYLSAMHEARHRYRVR
jgi:dihydroorotate dehydrogenase (fumarate)